jgi:hypothetical protein
MMTYIYEMVVKISKNDGLMVFKKRDDDEMEDQQHIATMNE